MVIKLPSCVESLRVSFSMSTVLIGDDTDLLILPICHTTLESCSLFSKPESKKSNKNTPAWNILIVNEQLDLEICTHILFIHAILGCDTTSRLYGIGKEIP